MIDFYEQIAKYKNGTLTGKALQAFEDELAKNAELQAAVGNHDIVEELIELMLEDDIAQVMNSIDEEGISGSREPTKVIQPEKKIRPLTMWRKLAASVLVLFVGIMGLKMYSQYTFGHDQILAKVYLKPDNPDAVKSVNPNIEDDIMKAKNYFYLNRFDDSKELYKELEKKDMTNEQKDEINFYLGNISLVQNDVQNGIEYFSKTNEPKKYEYLAQLYFLDRNTSALEELHANHPTAISTELLAKSKSLLYRFF